MLPLVSLWNDVWAITAEIPCHLQSQWMVKRLALLEFLLWLDTMKNVFQCNNDNDSDNNNNNHNNHNHNKGHWSRTGWTSAYSGDIDNPADQSLGWHLWQVFVNPEIIMIIIIIITIIFFLSTCTFLIHICTKHSYKLFQSLFLNKHCKLYHIPVLYW